MLLPDYPAKSQSEDRLREMRTLAMGLDMSLRGKIDSAGDLFMQRFKSLSVALRDNDTGFGRCLCGRPSTLALSEALFKKGLAGPKLLRGGGESRAGLPPRPNLRRLPRQRHRRGSHQDHHREAQDEDGSEGDSASRSTCVLHAGE